MTLDAQQTPPIAEDLLKQAWVWLRVLNADDVKAWDAENFKRWLQASPAHQAAFNEARSRWAVLKPLAGEVLRTDPESARRHRRLMDRHSPSRRVWLGAAASAAAVAAVAIAYPPAGLWPAPREWGADLRTATGEQRAVPLAMGTLTLNTRTSIRQQTEAAGIELLGGEAAVDLSGEGTRFQVVAGPGRSTASAGQFEVRYLDGSACVTCISGSVQVEHPTGTRRLLAGQQTRYDDASIGGLSTVQVEAASAWRAGQLVFDATPLIDVLAEVNRYRPGRVVLMNDAVRDNPVTGSFYIASLDNALSQLQHTFGLHARSLPAGLLVLS